MMPVVIVVELAATKGKDLTGTRRRIRVGFRALGTLEVTAESQQIYPQVMGLGILAEPDACYQL